MVSECLFRVVETERLLRTAVLEIDDDNVVVEGKTVLG